MFSSKNVLKVLQILGIVISCILFCNIGVTYVVTGHYGFIVILCGVTFTFLGVDFLHRYMPDREQK